MDKEKLTEIVKRLQEVNEIIKSLDPSIREASFKLLQEYIISSTVESKSTKIVNKYTESDKRDFFTKFAHDKPSDNVSLIMAYHYSQYGNEPILVDEIKNMANEIGIVIPNRPDMTLKQAKRDGKNLFTPAGRGRYKPTVHGEKFLIDTYGVKKGTKVKDQ